MNDSSASKQENTMSDGQKFELKNVTDWLSSEVDIRIKKKWLVVGAAAFIVLLLIALD